MLIRILSILILKKLLVKTIATSIVSNLILSNTLLQFHIIIYHLTISTCQTKYEFNALMNNQSKIYFGIVDTQFHTHNLTLGDD